MITKYGKQINGIGHFAQIEFDISQSKKSKSLVVDKCTWKCLNESYENFIVSDKYINFKDSVIKGIEYGISRIKKTNPIEVNLNDIVVSNTDSTISSMYAVGVISIFEGLNVELTIPDQGLIDQFVSLNFQKIEMSNFKKLRLSLYE